MSSYRYHPDGFVIRSKGKSGDRFAMKDLLTGREVALGSSWEVAYSHWLARRIAGISVPPEPTLVWLIREFGLRHRPGERDARLGMECDIQVLIGFMQQIGNPLPAALTCGHYELFRTSVKAGRISTGRIVRLLRRIWIWAAREGWSLGDCPWRAETGESAVREEIVDIVRRYLAPDVLALIEEMAVNGITGESVARAGAALRRAVRAAVREAGRDGRPDLIPALLDCELEWLVGLTGSRTLYEATGCELRLGHGRVLLVQQLTQKRSIRSPK